MKIIYIGDSNKYSTSFHRASALIRLKHDVEVIDPYLHLEVLTKNIFLNKFHYVTGYKFLQTKLNKWLFKSFKNKKDIDIIWIDGGELFGPLNVLFLKKVAKKVVLYNIDDPTGNRDKGRFNSLLKSLTLYDLCVVVRESTFEDVKQKGAKALLVSRSYDEVAHKEIEMKIPDQYQSDVIFIGTWIKNEQRDIFLLKLKDAGIKIKVWGDRWNKSLYWDRIKTIYQGQSLKGDEYVMAIKGAKISLGLLSKGNRDFHTTRSLEIPYAGGLLCAERTVEHVNMYHESVEAVFWGNVDECISVCKKLLENSNLREKIRANGKAKVVKLGVGNEDICKKILNIIKNDFDFNFNEK